MGESAPADARSRFRNLNTYRVSREWDRYEGTAQRRLFREIRTRFLARHAVPGGWVLDLGSGPGRFLPHIGGAGSRKVALDLSEEMLRRVVRDGGNAPERVRGDGVRPPFRPQAFQEVAVLGNAIGFAGSEADLLWQRAAELVRPSGRLILEVVAGSGERSAYLARLPPSSLPRLFRSPLRVLLSRVDREGFGAVPARKTEPGRFRRYDPTTLAGDLSQGGWTVEEVMAVAPALGTDPERLEAIERDPTAWTRLLELEEVLGRRVVRVRAGAAVLLSATAAPPNGGIK
jgi:SAM-dependent methyltransferase